MFPVNVRVSSRRIDLPIRKRDESPREDRERPLSRRRVGDSWEDTLLASRLMIGGGVVVTARTRGGGGSQGERSMADVLGN